MNKQEFLAQLGKGLLGLPQEDLVERIAFYSEMIDDRMEEGLSESEAVSEIGPVNSVVAQILADTPPTKLVKKQIEPPRVLKAWEIVLIVLGSPIWISLLITFIAIIIAAYIAVWSVIVTLWSIEGSFVACSLGGILSGILFACNGNALTAVAIISIGLVCAGLSIFMLYICKTATKGAFMLTKAPMLWAKKHLIKRGRRND